MTMRVPLEAKTPDEEKDFGIDWRDYWSGYRLAPTATVVTSTWEVPDGITKITDSVSSGRYTLIRLSGGTLDTTYTLNNEIIASTGERLKRAIEVRVMTPSDVLEL